MVGMAVGVADGTGVCVGKGVLVYAVVGVSVAGMGV